MITVLRVAQELSAVNYRKMFYRWTPPSLRDIERLVPVRASPVPLPLTPPSPDNGLHPHESSVTYTVKRFSPRLRGLGIPAQSIGDDLPDAKMYHPDENGDKRDQKAQGEEAKPPRSKSAKGPQPENGTVGSFSGQLVPQDQDSSCTLQQHHHGDASPGVSMPADADEAGETISPRRDISCPAQAPAMTTQGELQGGPCDAKRTASSSSDHSEENKDESPQPMDGRLQNPQEESTDKSDSVGAVMKKVDTLMAYHISGSGSEPMWLRALQHAEEMMPESPKQAPRHNLTPPTTLRGAIATLQVSTSPAAMQGRANIAPQASGVQTTEHKENGDQDQTFRAIMGKVEAMMALSLNTSGGSGSNQPPWLMALRLAEQNAKQQPHLSRRAVLPTPPPTPPPIRINKRKHLNHPGSPLGIGARKRVRQLSLPSPGQPGGAQAPTSPAPLPAESCFIPVLKESEFEDVLTRGQPTCLGSGAFGEVMLKRKKSGGALVAFKTLIDVGDPMAGYQEMLAELRAMMAVQHRREFPEVMGIVNLTTFAVEFVGDVLTMRSRTLRFVVEYPPASLNTLGLIKICLDIARGLQALHYAGWSHNDLHCTNVLVWQQPAGSGDNWGAKIIDLGKATRLDDPPPAKEYDQSTKTYCHANCIHISPELIEGTIQLGVLTDLYSLGYLFNVVSYSNPELTVIDTLHRHCKRVPTDRPTLQSIIQDIEGFQTALVEDALKKQKAASAQPNAMASHKLYRLF